MSLSILKSKIKNLPKSPGVYIYYGKKREILYVGKAGSLRDRVRSYFNGHDERETVKMMLPQIEDIKIQKTDTVLEALILESHLIKKLQPKYNAMGKDDKSFSYFVVTKEEFPRVLILRKTDLENKYKYVIPSLSRNLIRSSRRFAPQDDMKINNIYGPYTSKKQMEVALKILRKIFPFHSNNQKTEKGCLDFQIGRCPGPYAGVISKVDYAKNILRIRMILEGKKKNLVKKLEKEMKEFAKNNEFEKAADTRNKLFALKHIRDVALISEDNKLRVTSYELRDLRIEAYDISNISGQHAVGSMVVFKNNEPDKSQYRKFKIKTIKGADDVGMMKEVLLRRFKNDWPMPDLIILDGGLGHLNMAQKLISELGLAVTLVAVAKGPTRKNHELRIMNNELSHEMRNLLNNKNFIKQIMDEAHRFAINYHKKLRKKGLLT
jgi:excinuclease ABC subunit C